MPNATVSFGIRGSLQSDTILRLGLSGLFLKSLKNFSDPKRATCQSAIRLFFNVRKLRGMRGLMTQNLGVAKIEEILAPEIGLKSFGTFEEQGPVLQRVDRTMHWINHYPLDNQSILKVLVCWIVIYSVDSAIYPLSNWRLVLSDKLQGIPLFRTTFSVLRKAYAKVLAEAQLIQLPYFLRENGTPFRSWHRKRTPNAVKPMKTLFQLRVFPFR